MLVDIYFILHGIDLMLVAPHFMLVDDDSIMSGADFIIVDDDLMLVGDDSIMNGIDFIMVDADLILSNFSFWSDDGEVSKNRTDRQKSNQT